MKKPTRNTDAQYVANKGVVSYILKAGDCIESSTQVKPIADELVRNAIHVEEAEDKLVIRLIDSPTYEYRLSDFNRL